MDFLFRWHHTALGLEKKCLKWTVAVWCVIFSYLFIYFGPFIHQETWANDLNQVRELMTTFIDDTMRKTNDPEFTVSEVFSTNMSGHHLPSSAPSLTIDAKTEFWQECSCVKKLARNSDQQKAVFKFLEFYSVVESAGAGLGERVRLLWNLKRFSSSSSSASCFPRRIVFGMRSSQTSATWTWTTLCRITGSTPHTTRQFDSVTHTNDAQ